MFLVFASLLRSYLFFFSSLCGRCWYNLLLHECVHDIRSMFRQQTWTLTPMTSEITWTLTFWLDILPMPKHWNAYYKKVCSNSWQWYNKTMQTEIMLHKQKGVFVHFFPTPKHKTLTGNNVVKGAQWLKTQTVGLELDLPLYSQVWDWPVTLSHLC